MSDARPPARTRIDLHCHSSDSDRPGEAVLAAIGCPESYSDPEAVCRQALARGMDFVTITDHDTIAGALSVASRAQVIVGEELTCWFPEDGCKVHVLVWGLNEADHAALQASARDIYRVATYLEAHQLAHAVAHPLYRQNNKLTRWHLERLLLLFKGFECLNGAHNRLHAEAFGALLDSLAAAELSRLSEKHGLAPRWPEPHVKARTGGSDDHGLLNVGRTWTELPGEERTREDVLRCLREGRCIPGGEAGSSVKLAHTLYSVAVRYYSRHILRGTPPNLATAVLQRLVGERKNGAGVPGSVRRRVGQPARRVWHWLRALPAVLRGAPAEEGTAGVLRAAFLDSVRRRIDDRPELLAASSAPLPPLSDHEAVFHLGMGVSRELSDAVAAGIRRALDAGRFTLLFDAIAAGLAQQFVLLPYYFSFFHQNREKLVLRQLTGHAPAPTGNSLKVAWFTDTFDEANGAGRFIRDMLKQARCAGRALEVATCCTAPQAAVPGRRNFAPVFSTRLPYYEELDLNLPPVLEIMRWADDQQFDAVHVATPGPMGLCGLLVAAMLRAPVLGTYHTDLPAYAEQLTADPKITTGTRAYVRWFYGRLDKVFARSSAYRQALAAMGIDQAKLATIAPAVNADTFCPDRRDPAVWARHGIVQPRRLLYCGRVSAEKNLSVLIKAFRQLCAARSDVALVIAGDGTQLPELKRTLSGLPVYFLGRQSDDELARLYASADLFVFPSRTDTLGQAVLEAQASGLPALVSDDGGPREIVDDDVTGLVLPGADADRWCAAINDLLTDDPRRHQMARSALLRTERTSLAKTFQAFWQEHVEAVQRPNAAANATEVVPVGIR